MNGFSGKLFKKNSPPLIIAELSGNHAGKIDNALQMIKSAKQAGADAVKIQTYRADTMTFDHNGPGFLIENGLWKGKTLYDLYSEAYTPWEWHADLFQYARDIGITLFSSPFDRTAVDLLESLDCPMYKIASFELVDIPLIEIVAGTEKPLIMSTGMATLDEIDEAVRTARQAGASDIALLHCTSAYPTPFSDCHLNNIRELSNVFDLPVGLSDHTTGIVASVAAVAVGAGIIEKHFVLSRNDGGVDALFSLEPQEFSELGDACRKAWQAVGEIDFENREIEKSSRLFRRSLYIAKDIKAGEIFDESNIRSIRPGYGLHTRYYQNVLGKRCTRNVVKGTPLDWGMVEEVAE